MQKDSDPEATANGAADEHTASIELLNIAIAHVSTRTFALKTFAECVVVCEEGK